MQVTLQTNGSDCGIYAIAFATALCLGQSPGLLQFDESRMISHLAKCLEQGTFTMFPVCQTRRQIQIKATCVLDVYCACRMPSLPDTDMIECTSCKKWLHVLCVSPSTSVLECSSLPWFCDSCH